MFLEKTVKEIVEASHRDPSTVRTFLLLSIFLPLVIVSLTLLVTKILFLLPLLILPYYIFILTRNILLKPKSYYSNDKIDKEVLPYVVSFFTLILSGVPGYGILDSLRKDKLIKNIGKLINSIFTLRFFFGFSYDQIINYLSYFIKPTSLIYQVLLFSQSILEKYTNTSTKEIVDLFKAFISQISNRILENYRITISNASSIITGMLSGGIAIIMFAQIGTITQYLKYFLPSNVQIPFGFNFGFGINPVEAYVLVLAVLSLGYIIIILVQDYINLKVPPYTLYLLVGFIVVSFLFPLLISDYKILGILYLSLSFVSYYIYRTIMSYVRKYNYFITEELRRGIVLFTSTGNRSLTLNDFIDFLIGQRNFKYLSNLTFKLRQLNKLGMNLPDAVNYVLDYIPDKTSKQVLSSVVKMFEIGTINTNILEIISDLLEIDIKKDGIVKTEMKNLLITIMITLGVLSFVNFMPLILLKIFNLHITLNLTTQFLLTSLGVNLMSFLHGVATERNIIYYFKYFTFFNLVTSVLLLVFGFY